MNPRLRSPVLVVGLTAACGSWPGEGWRQVVTPCGLTIIQREDSPFAEDDIVEMEQRVTQYALRFEGDACAKLKGVRAHELDGSMTEYEPGHLAAGWAECWNMRLFYHRGGADEGWRKPWNTALWHEMLHVAQGCPWVDGQPDPHHPFWTERGYWNLPSRLGLE